MSPAPAQDDLVFGIRAIEETLKSGKTIERLLINKEASGTALGVAASARDAGVPVQYVPLEKLNRMTRGNHQGVIALVSPIVYQPLEEVINRTFEEGKVPIIVVLDRVTDVRNVGAVARTMECVGATALVVPGRGSAQLNSDAMKTSAGALNYLPVSRVDNLVDAILLLQATGFKVLAMDETAHTDLYQTDLTGPIAFVMGNEEEGISPTLLRRVDQVVKIPMTGKVESLNVSVAAGVCLYEMVRQRSIKAE